MDSLNGELSSNSGWAAFFCLDYISLPLIQEGQLSVTGELSIHRVKETVHKQPVQKQCDRISDWQSGKMQVLQIIIRYCTLGFSQN